MAQCKNCQERIEWAFDTTLSRWIPLEPIETHDDLPKSFSDANGELRADHRERCFGQGAGTLTVTRLRKRIMPEEEKNINHALRKSQKQRKKKHDSN